MAERSKLAERCEAAHGPSREADLDIAEALGAKVRRVPDYIFKATRSCGMVLDEREGEPDRWVEAPHYTASVDAALTLVPEGYRLQLSDWDNEKLREKGPWQAILVEAGSRDQGFDPAFKTRCEHAATMPLAICAAALRARAVA